MNILKLAGRGRAAVALRSFETGEVVLTDSPLIAVADVTAAATCAHCFRSIPEVGARVHCAGCGLLYCSDACRDAAAGQGHDVLCSDSAKALNALCAAQGVNYPRAAAAMLARSFGASEDFMAYWEAVNALVSMPVGDPDAMPPQWQASYDAVRTAVSVHMTSGADAFFSSVWDVRTYARLMGTLRLNSFSIRCPIDADASSTGLSATVETTSPEAEGSCGSGGSGCGTGDSGDEGGCGSSDGSGGGCGTYGGHKVTKEAKGGVAIYPVASFVNHSCGAYAVVHTTCIRAVQICTYSCARV
ncbi:hypothetical protein EON66_08185 [archaeon]|nr:MAG: hypothetical protein EON66_08185 [archaeon]